MINDTVLQMSHYLMQNEIRDICDVYIDEVKVKPPVGGHLGAEKASVHLRRGVCLWAVKMWCFCNVWFQKISLKDHWKFLHVDGGGSQKSNF